MGEADGINGESASGGKRIDIMTWVEGKTSRVEARASILIITMAIAAAMVGCGGSDAPAEIEPTLVNIQEFILTPACATSGCHDEIDQAGELDLSSAQVSYDAMVNVPSRNPVAKASGWIMVIPGDPDRSFLIRKMVSPGIGEGDPMPSAAQELHPYYVELIATWIENGAPR